MKFLTVKLLLLIAAVFNTGCTVKGYQGLELPEDQLATVRIKTPTISLIPVFWLFPLNMLAWFDDDWHETTLMDEVKVGNTKLNRFKTALVKPGTTNFYGKKQHIVDKQQIGSTQYSYGSCTCTETEDKDKKKEKKCERTVTRDENYRITAKDEQCRLSFPVQAKKHYEIFIRKRDLTLQDEDSTILANEPYQFGAEYSYETTESNTSTEICC